MTVSAGGSLVQPPAAARPPAWLIGATGLLAAGTLAMAVAETSLWMHYLIDAGESVSLVGLAFMLVAGIHLYRRGQLLVSLPLAVPWLLFPVITQGDQIIDNLSINWMRLVTHLLLGALFGTPVAIAVLAARYLFAPRHDAAPGTTSAWLRIIPGLPQLAAGRVREGSAIVATLLLVLEILVAVRFLGLLMVATLIVMIWAVMIYGSTPGDAASTGGRRRSERFALGVLIAGVVASLGLFVGYKNRPGAYQGSPAYYMDPSQQNAGFRLDRIAVPSGPPVTPADPDGVQAMLTGYARALERLLAGYYILDRNYNYDFHNHLFLRSTPLLAEYRRAGLRETAEAERLRAGADAAADAVRPTLDPANPLSALVDDVRAFTDFTFGRRPTLERMSGEFETTPAGLQHATHLYEGEGKVLGVQLNDLLTKHQRVLAAPATAAITAEFAAVSRAVHDRYADRIVGF